MSTETRIRTLIGLAVLWPALLAASVAVHGSGPTASPDRPIVETRRVHATVAEDSLAAAIQRRLGAVPPAPVSATRWSRVRALYAARGYATLWLARDDGNARGAALLHALAAAHEDALRPPFPIAMLRDALTAAQAVSGSSTPLANGDVLLTAAFVALAEDLLVGQVDPRLVAQSWHVALEEPSLDTLLARAVRVTTVEQALTALRPRGGEYRALRHALAEYRRIAVNGGWRRLPDGRALSPGDTAAGERVQGIGRRLLIEGYLERHALQHTAAAGAPAAAVYDTSLAAAIARFQTRHGLEADSVLGPATLAALNVSAEQRLAQIAANLERHRWLPHDTPARHLLVNPAGFRLQAFDGEREALRMRVIVGAPYDGRSTPSFQAVARAVIFRPSWNVPDRIAADEIWPEVRRDPGYLTRHHYEVVWRDGARRLRQRPGPGNALGLMKLDLPNPFNVYLHDTPTKALFCEDVRAFSHGCIRLEQPAALAAWALGWDAERVRQAMEEGSDERRVELERPFPVRVAYFTTYVEDGELHFAADVYRRDAALIRLLAAAARPDTASLRVARALAALLQD